MKISEPVIISLISAGGSIVTTGIASFGVYLSSKNRDRLKKIQKETNGVKEQLLDYVKGLNFTAGYKKGRE